MSLWILPAAFAALAVFFYLGKGNNLLIRSADEPLYDEKKLRLVSGSFSAGLAVFFLLHALLHLPLWLVLLVSVLLCMAAMILCNAVCMQTRDIPFRERSAGMIFLGICVALAIFLGVFAQSEPIQVTLTEDSLRISASIGTAESIPYGEILSVESSPAVPMGIRKRGMTGNRTCEGKFENKDFGPYNIYVYNNCETWIVLHTANGVVVFNCESEKQTAVLLYNISERVHTNDIQ